MRVLGLVGLGGRTELRGLRGGLGEGVWGRKGEGRGGERRNA